MNDHMNKSRDGTSCLQPGLVGLRSNQLLWHHSLIKQRKRETVQKTCHTKKYAHFTKVIFTLMQVETAF